MKAKNKNINLKLISNEVNAGLNVFSCKELNKNLNKIISLSKTHIEIQFIDIVALMVQSVEVHIDLIM